VMLESHLGNKQRASMMIAARRSITDIIQTPAYKSLFGTIYAGGIGSDATDAYKQADYAFNDVIAKTTWRPNDRSLFYVSLYSSNDDLAINYKTNDQSNNFQYQFSDISSWGNRGIGAGFERQINEEVNTQLTAGASRFSSELFAVDTLLDFRDGEISRKFRNDQNTLTDLSIQNDWQWKQSNGEYTFGAQWKNLRITRSLNDLESEGVENTQASLFSVFAQREWRIKAHQLNLGGRFNYFDPTGKWYPEWRLNYNYSLSNTWKVKGASSLTYQFIHRTLEQRLFQNLPDIWMISNGNELPVMNALQGSVGALYHSKGWTMDVEFYYKKLIDQAIDRTQWSAFADITTPYLIGNGFAKGMDLMVAKEWKAHHLSLSYTLSKARIEYPGLDQKEAVAPSYDQLHEVKIYYELKLNNWEASAIWVYGSGRPYTQFYGFYETVVPGSGITQLPIYSQINGQRLDPYHRLDLSIGYILTKRVVGWEFRAGCFNIYNQQNIRDVQYLSYPSNNDNYIVEKRNVLMLGRIPSIQITMTFR
jgi:ferric enterobactin receptor